MRLNADHTLAAHDLPVNLQSPERFTAPWSGSATWIFLPSHDGQPQEISMGLPAGRSEPLYVGWDDGKFRLFMWTDVDTDKRVWLEKAG